MKLAAGGPPNFECPPVAEVAISVQFKPIRGFEPIHLGPLYDLFREQLPKREYHPLLPHVLEQFGHAVAMPELPRLHLLTAPPMPLVWFLNEAGTELVQFQSDRFVRNWRKVAGNEEYPRYATLKPMFVESLNKLASFLKDVGLPELEPDQGEVTYVNHISQGDLWKAHHEVDKVFTFVSAGVGDYLAGRQEEVSATARFLMPGPNGQPIGRLYAELQPAYRVDDHEPILSLNMVGRGQPTTPGLQGVLDFLDVAHDWIVRGFAAITTPEAQNQLWRRKDI